MVTSLLDWWLIRISELLPRSWSNFAAAAPDGIVAEVDRNGSVSVSVRRGGRQQPVTLDAAARLAGRRPVSVRPPPGAVLEKHHIVPTASRRDREQLLRHELARITPFKAEELFWRWDPDSRAGDRNRASVMLTMVPKAAMAAALEVLAGVGLPPRFIETGSPERPRLLPVGDGPDRGNLLARGLVWTCAALAVLVVLLPVLFQERALWAADSAIEALQPTIRQAEALRRGIAAEGSEREHLAKEMQRTGDVLKILATITRILPDDTYLTDFSLHERQIVLGGRSAAAARLIAGLSADPAIQDAAFAAPVTRIEGSATEVFSIRASVAP